MPQSDRREMILDSAMQLVAERGWQRVSFSEIAGISNIPLAEIHRHFPTKEAIFAGFLSRVNEQVLAGEDPTLADDPPRDRLFDALMRRFDALAPYKPAIDAMLRDVPRDPFSAICRAPRLLHSMAWMLESAGVSTAGLAGMARVKALAALYLLTMRTWLRDDTPDLARTMAALDRNLTRAERLLRI